MATMPEQGQRLPDVDFITESGERLAAGDLGGQKTVLYFYPKDDTPGCTKEACAFRDRMGDYEGAGIQVYGVSLDSPESHRRFREKYNLNFSLVTDLDPTHRTPSIELTNSTPHPACWGGPQAPPLRWQLRLEVPPGGEGE